MIPKRATWFVVGAAVGAGSSLYARRKAHQAMVKLQPDNLAKSAVVKARDKGRDVVDAVREGRSAMKEKEAELRLVQGDPPVPDAAPAPTIVVIDAAGLIGSDEYRPRRDGPRRRSRR